jgi:epoxyqueuosine reductase
VRIAPAAIVPSGTERLRAAFRRGDFASWPYGDEYAAAASDPSAMLEGARAVVCIALAYAAPPPPHAPLSGRVSNYAWGDDYHPIVRRILDRIALEVTALGGRSKVACDAMPIAERAFAARAGLGWIGKHTNAIVPGLGSYVFLGELIVTLELEPDEPLRKTCGGCVRCVAVCPTGALRGDYTIDANRCVADLTQRPGWIPRELRVRMGAWIWGCDLCQEACPPVRLAGYAADIRFSPALARARPALVDLLQLRSGGFKRTFERSAMGWRGAALLRRNAAIALGNALDRSAVAALELSLDNDPHAVVRGHAAWALGRIGSPRARRILGRAWESEGDDAVRREISDALEP